MLRIDVTIYIILVLVLLGTIPLFVSAESVHIYNSHGDKATIPVTRYVIQKDNQTQVFLCPNCKTESGGTSLECLNRIKDGAKKFQDRNKSEIVFGTIGCPANTKYVGEIACYKEDQIGSCPKMSKLSKFLAAVLLAQEGGCPSGYCNTQTPATLNTNTGTNKIDTDSLRVPEGANLSESKSKDEWNEPTSLNNIRKETVTHNGQEITKFYDKETNVLLKERSIDTNGRTLEAVYDPNNPNAKPEKFYVIEKRHLLSGRIMGEERIAVDEQVLHFTTPDDVPETGSINLVDEAPGSSVNISGDGVRDNFQSQRREMVSTPAPTTPSSDPLAGSRGSTWGSQDRVASTQGTNPYVNSGYGWGAGERSEPAFGGLFGNLFGNSYAPAPKTDTRDRDSNEDDFAQNSTSERREPVAFADIYRMLTSYDRYLSDKKQQEQSYSDYSSASLGATQGADSGAVGGYGQITFRSDEFGEVVAYGVSEEQLRGILSDIASKNNVVNTGGLPSIGTDTNGDFVITNPTSYEGMQDTSAPSWLSDFVLAGGTATTDSSGYYGYVTSPDSKTVDVYDKDKGKLLTLESEAGKVNVGITNSDGVTVFLPKGGVLDASAEWSEFTKAFVDVAGREPTQIVDSYEIPELSPFDVVVRELYGDEALVDGIPFAPNSPEYTLSKDGELIPVGVIDAAMDVVKERAGVFGLQESIREVTDGKVQVFTSAVSIPLNSGAELTNIRIMPVPQQLLVLARLKGELEARGHRNVDEAVRTAIFNTYDSTAKKVAGITAFTVRIDEDGNPVGSTRTSFSIASLVSGIFVDMASVVEESRLSKNPIASFLGSIFGSKPVLKGQDGNVYRIKDAREQVQEPQTIGAAAAELIVEAVTMPFKIVGDLLKGFFGK